MPFLMNDLKRFLLSLLFLVVFITLIFIGFANLFNLK